MVDEPLASLLNTACFSTSIFILRGPAKKVGWQHHELHHEPQSSSWPASVQAGLTDSLRVQDQDSCYGET